MPESKLNLFVVLASMKPHELTPNQWNVSDFSAKNGAEWRAPGGRKCEKNTLASIDLRGDMLSSGAPVLREGKWPCDFAT
jgi:hypothetical protein